MDMSSRAECFEPYLASQNLFLAGASNSPFRCVFNFFLDDDDHHLYIGLLGLFSDCVYATHLSISPYCLIIY